MTSGSQVHRFTTPPLPPSLPVPGRESSGQMPCDVGFGL
jgi:hypothetical protein